MKKIFFTLLICFFFLWSACGKGKKTESQATVEVINGITYIHNTETPLYPDKKVTFEEELAIGGEDEEGNVILFQPMLYLVDNNENIYISEAQDQVFKVFSPDGQYLKTIGAKGSGPGEFQSIGHSGFTPDGLFLVTDYMARRTNLFDSDGQFMKSFPWTKFYSIVHLIKDKSYLTTEYVYSEDRQEKLFVKEIDFEGNEIHSYGEFTPPKTQMVRQGNIAFGMPIPHSPQSIFAGDQNREWLYHCLNNQYVIEVYDNTGKLFRKIDRPYTPVPFTSKDAEEFRARYENQPNEALRKMVKEIELPKVKTVISRMLVDDEGYLWAGTNETEKKEDQTLVAYDIFNPDGYYYAKVWCAITPGLFKKEKTYSMEADEETGYRTLKRYRVVWK